MEIEYAIVGSELGLLLVAGTQRGICTVRFGDSEAELEAALHREFAHARIIRNGSDAARYAAIVRRLIAGRQDVSGIPLDIRATAFQRRVWEALRSVPRGETRSYAQIAAILGNPRAARAVAGACAANPAAVVIPCHRVVRCDGSLGGYRWGIGRKKKLLEIERPDGAKAP